MLEGMAVGLTIEGCGKRLETTGTQCLPPKHMGPSQAGGSMGTGELRTQLLVTEQITDLHLAHLPAHLLTGECTSKI